MAKNPGKLRTYTWVVSRPSDKTSDECKKFQNYVKQEASVNRELLAFEIDKDGPHCMVKIRVRCYSCGKRGMNKFKRDLFITFPDAVTKEQITRVVGLN